MFFLLRMAFWLTLVLALLPTGSAQPTADRPQIGASDAMVAAKAAVSDMSSFCERQAEACDVGSKAVHVIGHRAQAGAKMVLEYLTGAPRNETAPAPDTKPLTTGSIPAGPDSQSTLRPDDLAPIWQGPLSHRAAQPHRDHNPGA